MDKFRQLKKIKEIFSKGENIIEYLKNIGGNKNNTIEDILISYEFQSGSYTRLFSENLKFKEFVNNYCKALSKIINKIDNVQSIIEIGVGEATTLSQVIKNLKNKPPEIFGFDISWSRLKFAKNVLAESNVHNVNIFNANLFEIPLLNNSIDVVYTSHSIEPNGGKEEKALEELYRITKKYLILLEPAYEFANTKAKARMDKNGYITKLYLTALKLGYKVVEHRLFDHTWNDMNPTGLIIIEKEPHNSSSSKLVCPISYTDLMEYNESLLYSKESFLAYPKIENIPFLNKENAMLMTHLLTDYKKYKKENNIINK